MLALAVTASGAATRQPVKSGVTLSSLSTSFAGGTVTAKRKACRVDRKVRLLIEPQGGGGAAPGAGPPAVVPVASAQTTRGGSWRISAPLEPGRTYLAEVESRTGGKFICRYAQSDDVHLAPPGGPPLAAG